MYKNENEIVNITGLSNEGNGVARLKNGIVVFTPMTVTGDKVEVSIVKKNKKFAIGRIEKIISPSNNRIHPDCKYFSICGGCSYRHITYDYELDIKKNTVYENIKRIGKINLDIDDILYSKNQNHYRNKAIYQVDKDSNGNILIGFYENNSHKIVDVDYCFLYPKIFSDIVKKIREFITSNNVSVYNKKTGIGLVRNIFIRHSQMCNEIMVGIIINGDNIPSENILIKNLKEIDNINISSVFLNVNKQNTSSLMGKVCKIIYGKEYIEETLAGLNFKISPLSFFQINKNVAEKLYGKALEFANPKKDDVILDLYCGTGTIGLSMASAAKHVYGIDIEKSSIKNAIENAKSNNIKNSTFFCLPTEKMNEHIEIITPNIVILDPPRSGSDEKTLKIVASLNPEKIVMISCDSATLARDLKYLDILGYKAVKAVVVDMFPRTSHVETVVLLSKKK